MSVLLKSHYTGGNSGWGTLLYECADCGEIVAEYECDALGIPVKSLYDFTDDHKCPIEDE